MTTTTLPIMRIGSFYHLRVTRPVLEFTDIEVFNKHDDRFRPQFRNVNAAFRPWLDQDETYVTVHMPPTKSGEHRSDDELQQEINKVWDFLFEKGYVDESQAPCIVARDYFNKEVLVG